MANTTARILISAVDQTRAAVNSAWRGLQDLGDAATKLNDRFGALGAAGSLDRLIAIGKQTIDVADGLNDMSQKTGIAVETLSGLSKVAEMSGTSLEAMEKGFKALAVNMVEANKGSKEASALFAGLGIDVADSGGKLKTTDTVLMELADRFKSI